MAGKRPEKSIRCRPKQKPANGSLQKFYRAEEPLELKDMPFPRYDLLDLKKYSLMKAFSVQTSRGCPFRCDFCSERFYLGQEYLIVR
jgi:radical SAM superfamily enzyme YgiQ (UPF0313 family)